MPFHRCTVWLADGKPIATDVNVTIETGEPDGNAAWHGTIFADHRTALSPGERYRLELADGRRGEFMVRRNTFAGAEGRAVAIHGVGPLTIEPRPDQSPK